MVQKRRRRWFQWVALAAAMAGITALRMSAQTPDSSWVSWVRANHHAIDQVHSPERDDFTDLQFLKAALDGRRIVQLGESGHGVAEFNSVKVRLIKFLHEQMGFDVIAFESSMFECFTANASINSAANMLRESIFTVWATEEVRPLFEYIRSTQLTDRPLVLAGFDSQISSFVGVAQRPAFLRRLITPIDPAYAEQVAVKDAQVIDGIRTAGLSAYARGEEANLIEFYGRLESFLLENLPRLTSRFPGDPSPHIAYRAAWSMQRFVRQVVASADRPGDTSIESGISIRDQAMADNLTYLARQIYPDRKVITWAHNFHIRHQNARTPSQFATMGSWVKDRFADDLYTIGLYMYQGTAAWNNRTVYTITPAQPSSMEWILAQSGKPALFVDFARQQRQAGNSWMFQDLLQREWGTNAFHMTIRDQYDGVVLVDNVSSPRYLTF